IPNGNGNTTNHIGNVENGEFAINVQFRETGNFNLGIIPGSQGTSKIVPISVVPSLPDPISKTNPANKATALSVSFSDNQTTFNWTNPSQITKLTVYQTNKSKTFFFRQERMAFTPEYKDFEGFGENKTYFKVDSATTSTTSLLEITSDWTTSSTSSFQATTHTFADVFDDQITYSTIPDISEKSQMIRFSGTTKIDIFREAAIITASGTVARVNMTSTSYGEYYGNDIIQNGNKYTFEYTPTEKGTYIIEINQTNGQAVINKPVFVGSVIPLVPDFFDLYETPPLQKGTINIEKSRNELLGLINETRRKMGLSEVTLSDELNTLAQSHTSDMIVNNFFAHINKNGESPNDRRIKMGITTEVGENLARTSSIKFAHEGLMRSAVHRENIIGEDWTRVGIGIYKDGEGYYVITEEFSTQPLQSKDIDTYEQEIVDAINGARTTHDMFIDPTLTGIAENWSITMANQDFLGFEAPNSEKLINKITEQNIQVQVQAFVVESLNLNSIKTKILEDTEVTNSNWNSMGLSMKIGKTGELKFTLLYTP
ncbi:MAG: CAP domain-containing protein, partial [Patescibacteria group bacterium]